MTGPSRAVKKLTGRGRQIYRAVGEIDTEMQNNLKSSLSVVQLTLHDILTSAEVTIKERKVVHKLQ